MNSSGLLRFWPNTSAFNMGTLGKKCGLVSGPMRFVSGKKALGLMKDAPIRSNTLVEAEHGLFDDS